MRRPVRRFPIKPKPIKVELPEEKKCLWQRIAMGARNFFTLIGVVFFISIIGYGVLISHFVSKAVPELPKEMILTYHFKGSLSESQSGGLGLGGGGQSLRSIIDVLEQARSDSAVKGFVARISANDISLAQIYDLNEAIKAFRGAGKFTYVFSDSYGEDGRGMGDYLLASAFEQIWLQPIGSLNITGVDARAPYFKGLFDKLGVQPDFYRREEFKSVMEPFMREDMSAQSKQEAQERIESLMGHFVSTVALNRGLDESVVRNAIDRAPILSKASQRLGLVDEIGYIDQLFEEIKALRGFAREEGHYVGVSTYLSGKAINAEQALSLFSKDKKQKHVAYVSMEGPILSGSSNDGGNPFADAKMIFSRDYMRAVMQAADDENIDALILRLNSPGGSPVASETIRRAVVYASKVKKKPVYVSMGTVAASGGYWIASGADKIIATPATITGSIGVASGKFVLREALTKIGMTVDGVIFGENADFLSPVDGFDEAGVQKMNEILDDIYNGFLVRVAEGRNMSIEEAKAVAKGRVWTGEKAVEVGLVDVLGGIQETKRQIAEVLEVDLDNLHFVAYPRPKSFVEQLMFILDGSWAFLPSSIEKALIEAYQAVYVAFTPSTQLLYSDH